MRITQCAARILKVKISGKYGSFACGVLLHLVLIVLCCFVCPFKLAGEKTAISLSVESSSFLSPQKNEEEIKQEQSQVLEREPNEAMEVPGASGLPGKQLRSLTPSPSEKDFSAITASNSLNYYLSAAADYSRGSGGISGEGGGGVRGSRFPPEKVAIILDISPSMKRYLPRLSEEIKSRFPSAMVFGVNGRGWVYMAWSFPFFPFHQWRFPYHPWGFPFAMANNNACSPGLHYLHLHPWWTGFCKRLPIGMDYTELTETWQYNTALEEKNIYYEEESRIDDPDWIATKKLVDQSRQEIRDQCTRMMNEEVSGGTVISATFYFICKDFDLDVIYWISDFEELSYADCIDVQSTIQERKIKLFVLSQKMPISSDLKRIALASGGGFENPQLTLKDFVKE